MRDGLFLFMCYKMCPSKCGGISLSFSVLCCPKPFLSEIQPNCCLVAQVGVFGCAGGLALEPDLSPCLQAPRRPAGVKLLTRDLLEQFSIGRTHGH